MTTSVDIKSCLNELDPYEFERLVATLWKVYGWRTTLTSQSHDEGIDVIADRPAPVEKSLLIQVKAYKTEKVYSDEIRYYSDLYTQNPDADNVVLVTASSFSSPARDLAAELDVSLVSGEDLNKLVRNSKLQFADLASVASWPSTNEIDWLWKSLDSIETTEHPNIAMSAQRVKKIASRLRKEQNYKSLSSPAMLHPGLPYQDQSCTKCISSTAYGLVTQHAKNGLRQYKICSECLRLSIKEEDHWELVKRFHPFDNTLVEPGRTPVRLSKSTVCPVCQANWTLWIAEDRHSRELLSCIRCNTVWKLVTGTLDRIYWRCIQCEQQNIKHGATYPELAFRKHSV